MKLGTIDTSHLRGLSDKVLGLTKEIVGTVLDNRRLRQEGEAQQARGSESLKALRKEAEAQKKEAKAGTFEQKQKAAQRVKEDATA